jgi:hypothetical protein
MNAHDTNILANAAQSGAINKLRFGATVAELNGIQTESWLALARLCRQAAKEREDANAAAAGDELDRQLDGAA